MGGGYKWLGGFISLIEEAKKAINEKDWPTASDLLSQRLDQDVDDFKALALLGFVLMNVGSNGLAVNINKRAAELAPGDPAIFHNIGKAYHDLQKDREADEYFRKAVKIKPNFSSSLEGLGMSALFRAEFEECINFSNRALAENPDAMEAKVNRGMAYLALRRWREGWRDYAANDGKEKNRKELEYGDTPKWTGTKGLDIVTYGEQGLGDEICFASCLPELIRDSKSVTIECEKRNLGLFKRSFPTCEVRGTRYKKDRAWVKNARFDAKVAMGALPGFYRLKDSDFPPTPYLTPNPDHAIIWRAVLDSLGPKPKIGLTWTGGIPKTGQYKRSVTLDTFAPFFKEIDADWVSLQYKDSDDIPLFEDKYGIKVHDWDFGSKHPDYDQTVALISQLDFVISVTTAVVDACAAIGKECYVLVPTAPMWRYGKEGDWYPWGKSVHLFRQKGKDWPVYPILQTLRDKYPAFVKKKEAA